jgi:PAS domain S-box-containing protein
MEKREPTREELFEKIRALEERLWEMEQTIEAIQSGEVDALVVHKPDGEQLYTLTGADYGYRVLVESITEGALILSSDDSIYYCNSTLGEMLQLPIQKIISKKLDSYVAPESGGQLMGLIKQSHSLGEAKGELLMRRNDGTLLPVNVSFNCMSVGDFEGVCAVITDLSEQKQVEEELRVHRTGLERLVDERTADLAMANTHLQQEIIERKRAEEELREANEHLELRVQERTAELRITNKALTEYSAKLESLNERLQEFAFVASHDLQEPLRKIQTFGEMLGRDFKDALGEEGRDYLMRMTKAANRMSDLMQSLLDYSRIETMANPFEPTDLAKTARDALNDLELVIRKADARVEIDEMPVIDADPVQMRQLFQNLIGNSIKFCRDGEKPVVKIHGHAAGGMCKIFVEDNGIGFEAQYLGRIFKPFQRLHGRSGNYEGTGMGLAICRKIVERHWGSITAKSAPGEGATFIIQLPVKQSYGKER